MTLGKSWGFQVAVVALIENAFPGVLVVVDKPIKPPARYIRIDGFTIAPSEAYKNRPQVEHGFTVHIFDAPEGGCRSLAWVKEGLGILASAIDGFQLDTKSQPARMAAASASLDPRGDGLSDAHAFIRFTTTIGG